jgi:pseudouridine-5'-phosphate glycosidase
MEMDNRFFKIKQEVKEALEGHSPILALESAVITHGLPRPHNLELALDLESIARANHVTPATIGVIDGVIHVGLDQEKLRYLASTDGLGKFSRRDLSIACTAHKSGGTTVAATLFSANFAGIKVFSTGGIGGVHRNAPFDMSADLPELARTPMIVVCSGAKAILDLPATREVLETMGVPIIGYQTDEFPAFYSSSSGLPVDRRVESAEEIACLYFTHSDLRLDSALLVVNPPPLPTALPGHIIDSAVNQAVKESEELKIVGGSLTPFLLRRVSEITGGESLAANMELLRENVRVACQIAKNLVKDNL